MILPRSNLPCYLILAVLLSLAIQLDNSRAADSEFMTPFDKGAIGDGVHDDTNAVRSALSEGKMVALGSGIFRLTASLTIPSAGGLIGPGELFVDFDTSSIDPTNTAVWLGGNDIRVKGIRIRKKFVDGSYGTGIQAQGRKNLNIEDVDISGYSARYGIHLITCESFIIRGCRIHDFMMNTTADMIADSPAGIRLTSCFRGLVIGNRIERIEVGPQGLVSISPIRPAYGPQGYQSDDITSQASEQIIFQGNMVETSGEGIDILYSKNCILSGNVVKDIYFQGIKALAARFNTFSGNQFAEVYQGIGLAAGRIVSGPPPCVELDGVVGSVVGGTEDPDHEGDNLSHVADGNYSTRTLIRQTNSTTYGFTLDLLKPTVVTDVVLVSIPDYRVQGHFPGSLVTVETSDSAGGPFTLQGNAQLECMRPNPSGQMLNEEIGRAATQSEARRIALADPVSARYLRINAAYCLDNNQLLAEVHVNHGAVLHRFRPLGNTFQNLPQIPFYLTDGNTTTFYNPKVTAATVDLDLGHAPMEFDKIHFVRKPNDGSYLPRSGKVWVSSMDDPDHFDSLVHQYDLYNPLMHHADVVVQLPSPQTKRYVRISWDRLQSDFRTETRIAEILVGDATPCSSTPAELSTTADGNALDGNVVLNPGGWGSFGSPGTERVRYSVPCGIDLNDNPRFNAVSDNLMADNQVVETMQIGIQGVGSGTGNILSTNLTAREPEWTITATPTPTSTLSPIDTPTRTPTPSHSPIWTLTPTEKTSSVDQWDDYNPR